MEYLSKDSAEHLELISGNYTVIRTVRVNKAGTRCGYIVEARGPHSISLSEEILKTYPRAVAVIGIAGFRRR